jgi:hypothetical protein
MWLRRDRHQDIELVEPYATDDPGEADTLREPPHEELPDPGSDSEITLVERPSLTEDTGQEDDPEQSADESPQPPQPRPHLDPHRAAQRRRARIVARRRRTLLWSVLLVLASTVTAATGVMPWWGVAPFVLLLCGYLVVLRTAVRIDTERRQALARSRARRAARRRAHRHALELAAQQAQAEIIELDLAHRSEPFDQYADPPRRAVGH